MPKFTAFVRVFYGFSTALKQYGNRKRAICSHGGKVKKKKREKRKEERGKRKRGIRPSGGKKKVKTEVRSQKNNTPSASEEPSIFHKICSGGCFETFHPTIHQRRRDNPQWRRKVSTRLFYQLHLFCVCKISCG